MPTPKFEDIRAALCYSRGGWSNQPRAAVQAMWDALTPAQQKGYLARVAALPKADREAFAKELQDPQPDPKPAKPKPAGDEFAPLPKADDDTTDPVPKSPTSGTAPTDPANG